MDLDRLRSRSRLMKKRLGRRRSEAGAALGASQSAFGVYEKEFGEAEVAHGALETASKKYKDVYGASKKSALKTFQTTATGQKIESIGKKYGMSDLSSYAKTRELSSAGGMLRNELRKQTGSGSKYGQAKYSRGLLDAYFSGKPTAGGQVPSGLVQRHARNLNYDTTGITFSGGRATKSRQGKKRWMGSLLRFQWDPFHKWEEDVTGDYSKSATTSRLKGLWDTKNIDGISLGDLSKDIGYLTGVTDDFEGKETHDVSKRWDKTSGDFAKYKTDIETGDVITARSEKKSAGDIFEKEKGEVGTWDEDSQTGTGALADWKKKEGLFTSAKETFETLGADYATLTGRIKKFERLGFGEEIKSKKFKRAKVGAGSYIA